MYRDKVFKIIDSIRSAYMNKYSQSSGTAIFLKYEGKKIFSNCEACVVG